MPASLIRSSLSLAYQTSAVRALADLCSQGVIVVVGNYYFAACLTRPRGTSACSPCFIASVEAVAPPQENEADIKEQLELISFQLSI